MVNLKVILEFVAALIVSVGGAGAIIIGVSKWFGEVMADKLLEKEKAKYTSEIEELKSELQQEIDKAKAIQDKALYISKAQYDNESKIYREIWEAMRNCIMYTERLYPTGLEDRPTDEAEKTKMYINNYNDFGKKFNCFNSVINKYAPFYKDEFYEKFLVIRDKCGYIGAVFKRHNISPKNSISFRGVSEDLNEKEWEEVYVVFPKEIKELENELKNGIRDYLLSLELQ